MKYMLVQLLKKLSQCLTISWCLVYDTMLRNGINLKKKISYSTSCWLCKLSQIAHWVACMWLVIIGWSNTVILTFLFLFFLEGWVTLFLSLSRLHVMHNTGSPVGCPAWFLSCSKVEPVVGASTVLLAESSLFPPPWNLHIAVETAGDQRSFVWELQKVWWPGIVKRQCNLHEVQKLPPLRNVG